MTYYFILVILILAAIIWKISPYLYLLVAGTLIIFHPILLSKNAVLTTKYLSDVVFILMLVAFIIIILKKILGQEFNFGYQETIEFINKNISKILTCLVLLILIFYLPISAFFATLTWFLITALILRLGPRIFAGLALIFLASCSVFLIIKEAQLAEQAAIYTYSFLALTVILQIIEYKRANKFSGQKLE